jgi:hypothetical protein
MCNTLSEWYAQFLESDWYPISILAMLAYMAMC